jgi:hypothetical protein
MYGSCTAQSLGVVGELFDESNETLMLHGVWVDRIER